MRRLRPAILVLMIAAASCSHPDEPAPDKAARLQPAGSGKPCVNLNTAGVEELMSLPDIGEAMSRKIVEYRERNGPFRRAQEVIIIDGFSDNKYREIAGLICVD